MNMLKLAWVMTLRCCVGCLVTSTALAQSSVQAVLLDQAPVLDGVIDAGEWSSAAVIDTSFVQIEPSFGAASPYKTVVRIGQTATALYVAFEAFDPEPARLAAAVTQRDGDLDSDDSVSIAIDTFGDERTAYLFRTNALATQEDGRIADNGRTIDLRWDAAWRSAATRQADRWVAELEIPFAILRYAGGSTGDWRINFVRSIPRSIEKSMWAGPGETLWRVSSFGGLSGVRYPPRDADKWVFIPYGLTVMEQGRKPEYETGIDVRWRPVSTFGVDLTVNPDFALVEADVEEINLTRFELRVPEKRPFFLEGNEMFNQRINQFYSRRIGDIAWGAKSNGTVGRTGFSTIYASEDREPSAGVAQARAEYGIVRLQRGLARGSNVGFLAANRHLDGENAGSAGLDANLFFTDTLGMTAQFMRVHGPAADGGLAWFVRPSFDSSTTHFHVRYQHLDQGIRSDINAVGFLNDDDRREIDTNVSRTFWFKSGAVERVQPMINYNRYESQEGVLRSWDSNARIDAIFRSGWELRLQDIREFKLFEKEYRNHRTVLTAGWNGRDGRSVSAHAGTGINFDNDLLLYGVKLRWPVGDHWRFAYDLTRLELEPDTGNESTWIHVFETNYSFTPDLFLKLFIQTNSAIDKENIQVLGVWRFKPPFGSLQIAYQRGTSDQGQRSQQGDSFFTKLAWVF